MRALFLVLIVCSSVVATAAAPGASIPLHGVARVDGRTQPNVVVWLEGGPAAVAAREARQPVMDQRSLQFYPQVLAVRVGTTVKFPNGDRVFHNVFSFKDGKRFDLGVYPTGAVKYVRFDRAGVSRLFCNIHPKMAAYIVAVDSPYFATSDGHGAFRLDVPPGTYTWHAWRAGGDLLKGTVTVTGSEPLALDWSLDAARDRPLDSARDRPLDSARDRPLDAARDRP